MLKSAFGAETLFAEITANRVSEFKINRLRDKVKRHGEEREISPATLNRELAVLRHLLRLANEEWEVLSSVPRVILKNDKPEGRIKWLEPDEEAWLLTACVKSRNPHLAKIVTVALETGLRRGELLRLTWDRVDLSRRVLRLEQTKSGKRREVPMRQVVYDILARLPGPREGRVWPSDDIHTAFSNAVATAGLEDFHLHDCRHPPAPLRVVVHDARRGSPGAEDDPESRQPHHDDAVRAPEPDHLRSEIAKTERPAPSSTQASMHETHEAPREVALIG